MRLYLGELDQRIRQAQKKPSAETLKRIRVLTRRLRLALKIFQKIVPPQAKLLSQRLAWLQHATDEARELYVHHHVLAANALSPQPQLKQDLQHAVRAVAAL